VDAAPGGVPSPPSASTPRRPIARHGAQHQSPELFRLYIDSVTDYGLITVDQDGLISTWNSGAARLHGYTADEIVGQHVSVLYAEDEVADGKPERELAIAVAEGRFEDEGWRVRKDGSSIWTSAVITAIRGEDGRLVGFGQVTRDLTERKRGEDELRESEEKFRLLVTSVADYAIFLLNVDGTVASWNVGAERLKGYRADEIIGRHFSRFYSDEDRRAGVPANGLRSALENGRWESEGWRVRKDGSSFWADVVITALRDRNGVHRGFTKVTRDLTERKRNEDALRGLLAREREATARLRELDHLRNELVAIIAHDVRAPVGVLQGLLHLLRSEWETLTRDGQLDLIDRTVARAEMLESLVEDVFDMARIEAAEFRVDCIPIDLVEVIEQVMGDADASFPGRKIVLRGSLPGPVLADDHRLWQVLTNLVSNAMKFSPDDSVVDIEVAQRDGEAVVGVTDRGSGIPEDQRPLLFQRFTRLPQTTPAPGSGIGLYIAKSLIEAMNGCIWLDSIPGMGSTFRIALPLAPAP
jgi:PAS domain S-box-containing protein